ncbi:LysR substrate-binding domain-containing protein [Paraburkholderia haematera]|uniref:HTH-type transcriptional regulator DmlR n=1 Tax=Paraburkholderia haematera TaxID=2793077 RepID=A0ABM8SGX3_9BURK|nr:LysR substrate-binding domain-containing protein [Paraburkholderia haematera]CAE6809189.1 HTH-type transcriptional regulator DmlR [Paraburkholderia haematera]
MPMLDFNDFNLFVQLVNCGGITAASQVLNQPKSSISRRLIDLEENLGVRLIQRTSRSFIATDAGEAFYRHCLDVVAAAEHAEVAMQQRASEPAGNFRFSCPTVLGQVVVAKLLPRFMSIHPKINVIEHVTNRAVDLIEERFDLVLRLHEQVLEDSTLIQRDLCSVQLVVVASPSFLDAIERPNQISDLRKIPGLDHRETGTVSTWDLRQGDAPYERVQFQARLRSNDMVTIRQAAIDGVGMAALPEYFVKEDIAAGRLERLLPEYGGRPAVVSVITPSRRGVAPAVRRFIDFLIAELPLALSSSYGIH